jgi:hypothetical protein
MQRRAKIFIRLIEYEIYHITIENDYSTVQFDIASNVIETRNVADAANFSRDLLVSEPTFKTRETSDLASTKIKTTHQTPLAMDKILQSRSCMRTQ